jgi:hypothetical protein
VLQNKEARQPCIIFLGCGRFLDATAYGAPGECTFLDNKGNCCHVNGPAPILSGLESGIDDGV